ncbi:MAG: hypothetical protein AAF657_35060 [Acidobacteriota bacterium]
MTVFDGEQAVGAVVVVCGAAAVAGALEDALVVVDVLFEPAGGGLFADAQALEVVGVGAEGAGAGVDRSETIAQVEGEFGDFAALGAAQLVAVGVVGVGDAGGGIERVGQISELVAAVVDVGLVA